MFPDFFRTDGGACARTRSATPGPDGAEPASSPLPPEDEAATGQGLYVCLPAEQITLTGLAQNGETDTMAPGPLLRFAARHAAGTVEDTFAADELAAEQMHYSTVVKTRLPLTFATLGKGQIHPVHVRIIEDETSVLSDADAAKADRILADLAPGMTFGELRAAAHKLVLQLDPEAAKKRKEAAARRDAHVRPFRETSGNAGLVARELPRLPRPAPRTRQPRPARHPRPRCRTGQRPGPAVARRRPARHRPGRPRRPGPWLRRPRSRS